MFTRFVAGAFLVMVGCGAARAENLPDGYPRTYDLVGTLQAVDRHRLTLVVNDLQLSVSSTTRVHTPQGGSAYLGALKKGQTVGVRFIDPGGSNPTAGDVWVIPGTSHFPPAPGH